jgi:hypothetical protein
MKQAISNGFVDEEEVQAGPAPIILDRSTLERWAECPHQAFHVDRHLVPNDSFDAQVGAAVHDVLSRACAARAMDATPAHELRDSLEVWAAQARPDIQPAVVAALRRAYPIVQVLTTLPGNSRDRAPEDLSRFDGGKGERSGQLAFDLLPAAEGGSRGPIRLTTELDLLLATASPAELEIVDWKAGRKQWTATDVAESFQFQFQAAAVFRCYPDVERVSVRVFMTRDGEATSPVVFSRERHLYAITQRLLKAVEWFLRFRDAESPEDVEAWPSPDKCGVCPAAMRCCVVDQQPERDVAAHPEQALRRLVVLEEQAGRLKRSLSALVRENGKDIVASDVAFGVNKPKAARAPTCDVYSPSKGA